LDGIRNSDISETFLFFDYDFQNSQLSLDEINRRVEEMLTTGLFTMPRKKSDIGQLAIFNNQVMKYVKPNENVAILNSFPIFIYEYMK